MNQFTTSLEKVLKQKVCSTSQVYLVYNCFTFWCIYLVANLQKFNSAQSKLLLALYSIKSLQCLQPPKSWHGTVMKPKSLIQPTRLYMFWSVLISSSSPSSPQVLTTLSFVCSFSSPAQGQSLSSLDLRHFSQVIIWLVLSPHLSLSANATPSEKISNWARPPGAFVSSSVLIFS
jgi:hypothetical protein